MNNIKSLASLILIFTITLSEPLIAKNDLRDTIIHLNHGADDVEERYDGYMNTHSSDLELIHEDESGDQVIGLRYQVNLSNENTVIDARIQFTTDEISIDDTKLEIRIVDSLNSKQFQLTRYTLSDMSLLDDVVNWVPEKWEKLKETGVKQRTNNLASLINQITRKRNWNPCSHVTFVIIGKGRRTAFSYDGSKKLSPRLELKYSGPEHVACEAEKYIRKKPVIEKRVVASIPRKSTKVNPHSVDKVQREKDVTLRWSIPKYREDGSLVKKKDLKSYKIYYGNVAGTYISYVMVKNINTKHYEFKNLKPGYYYFSISVIDKHNKESVLSNFKGIKILK